MKKTLVYLAVLFSTQAFADQIDCVAAVRNYQSHLDTLKRECTQASECRADHLKWDSCARPVIHSDPSLSPLIAAALADLARICPRPARSCPEHSVKPICIDRICEDSANLGGKNGIKIAIQFMKKSSPLVGAKVNLDADTGIRCVTTPCDSRRVVESFVTDQEGKIYISVGKIMSLMNGSTNPNVIHHDVGPDGYALTIENIGYRAINLSGLLVDTKKVMVVEF
jgi:hypothetical protein